MTGRGSSCGTPTSPPPLQSRGGDNYASEAGDNFTTLHADSECLVDDPFRSDVTLAVSALHHGIRSKVKRTRFRNTFTQAPSAPVLSFTRARQGW
jgi:hypothetical protein